MTFKYVKYLVWKSRFNGQRTKCECRWEKNVT